MSCINMLHVHLWKISCMHPPGIFMCTPSPETIVSSAWKSCRCSFSHPLPYPRMTFHPGTVLCHPCTGLHKLLLVAGFYMVRVGCDPHKHGLLAHTCAKQPYSMYSHVRVHVRGCTTCMTFYSLSKIGHTNYSRRLLVGGNCVRRIH